MASTKEKPAGLEPAAFDAAVARELVSVMVSLIVVVAYAFMSRRRYPGTSGR